MSLGYGAADLRLATDDTWLASYAAALTESGLGDTSVEVVVEDARHIAASAVPPVGDDGWHDSRVRTGVVMGAVQSGKTASMLGVAAHALDLGVNVVVILAGTRTALWMQTLARVRAQLDTVSAPMTRRVFLPQLDLSSEDRTAGSPQVLYRLASAQVRRALSKGRPLVLVVMKQVDHLAHASAGLHETVFPEAADLGVPVRMLVIDDEADDSSISGDVAALTARELQIMKQVPRRILDLWEVRQRPGQTAAEHVFATYIGYTATPQANFLQDLQNPLAPRDFVASLRTPGPDGAVAPRSLSYRVPEGIIGWYTGSDVYYGSLGDQLLVVGSESGPSPDADTMLAEASDEVDVEAIADAVRAYIVAAAIRLRRAPNRLGPTSARPLSFDSAAEASESVCSPSCMLIHPSSAKQDHFAVADVVKDWWRGPEGKEGSSDGILLDLAVNEPAWRRWVDSYGLSAGAVFDRFDRHHGHGQRRIPDWDEIHTAIVNELIPATRIAVVNSDPAADDRPRFSPVLVENKWRAAPDLSTIFVSGNVMARGLTLEGLLTTSFTREASAPLADTQMQMQRWFGYRGSYIDLCRVFLSEAQRELFVAYADADHALRNQVLTAMEADDGRLPDFTVLQGDAFQATGKVTGLRGLPLSPGRRPFVRYLNPPDADDANLALVSSCFIDAHRREEIVTDRRGMLDRRRRSLTEIADLLDSMRYVDHGSSAAEQRRWASYGRLATLGSEDLPVYRAPDIGESAVDLGTASPFTIAAYLRFWSASLDRRVRGLFTDDEPAQQWSLLDLAAKYAQRPRFRIGLRFGNGPSVEAGPMLDLGSETGTSIRTMKRDVRGRNVVAAWGSRARTDSGYTSDDLFDYILGEGVRDLHPDGTRRTGSDGLVLFHLIHRPGGRGGIAVGLSIPSGGPHFMQATTTLQQEQPDE